jgi:NADH:ubiquinone oxidoreductase subunit F (NADH-binding)/NADH:ubiquinone oxidoreductase subunit E
MSAPAELLPVFQSDRATQGVFEDLRLVQDEHGYVPAHQIEKIARRRGVHVRDVHTVASFYPHIHLKPPVRVDVRVCDDMTCHLHGGRQLLAALQSRYASRSDVVTVRDISCVGRCDHAPLVSINDRYYEEQSEASAGSSIDREVAEPSPRAHSPAPRSPQQRGFAIQCDPYADEEQHYSVFRELLEHKDYVGTLQQLKDGELKGMGGAGFPTHIKWEGAMNSPGAEKYVVCNADESEPGTIKDRFILQYLPHLVFEGMMVCGAIVGARKGYLYVRHEYELQTEVLREELAALYHRGLLGDNIQGSGVSFDLEIFVSPGGYICGEETALMEAIMGHRAEPRNKPPRTVNVGLWFKPTALNNVETFLLAITILGKGVEWYKAQGRPGYPGLKFVGVSGHVRHPGVFEVPMGISYRDLIFNHAGGPPPGVEIIGFAPSGPSSGYLPASLLDTPLDWKTLSGLGSMVGSGAVVVCGDTACMLDMALCAVAFYRNESCGKCVPCRIGTQKLVDILQGWTKGTSTPRDLQMLADISDALRLTSICGLGQIAPAPIQSVMKHFPELMREHLEQRYCRAGVCFV